MHVLPIMTLRAGTVGTHWLLGGAPLKLPVLTAASRTHMKTVPPHAPVKAQAAGDGEVDVRRPGSTGDDGGEPLLLRLLAAAGEGSGPAGGWLRPVYCPSRAAAWAITCMATFEELT